jgi:hypothetical protein
VIFKKRATGFEPANVSLEGWIYDSRQFPPKIA